MAPPAVSSTAILADWVLSSMPRDSFRVFMLVCSCPFMGCLKPPINQQLRYFREKHFSFLYYPVFFDRKFPFKPDISRGTAYENLVKPFFNAKLHIRAVK